MNARFPKKLHYHSYWRLITTGANVCRSLSVAQVIGNGGNPDPFAAELVNRYNRADIPMRVLKLCRRIKSARHAEWLWNWIDDQEQPEPLWAIMRGTLGRPEQWSIRLAMKQAEPPRRKTYLATGDDGHVEFDETGAIVDGDGYPFIESMDVAEFIRTYGELADTDILNIGYWTKSGYYEQPEPELRGQTEQAGAETIAE